MTMKVKKISGLRHYFLGFKVVVAGLLSIVLVSACGGGGGDSSERPAAETTAKPTVNAGVDLVVSSGARVDLNPNVLVANVTSASLTGLGLELKGSSAVNSQIVGLTWVKTEGPTIAISSSNFNDGKIYFVAPSTNGASSIKITFKLTLTNAAGLSAEDTVSITVNRVNQAPVASAGDDVVVNAGEEVKLSGSLSTDADGSIATYKWNQAAGTAASIGNDTGAQLQFTAPEVSEETLLVFGLTVEDNEGKQAVDQITVRVVPTGIAQVKMHFPPAQGVYSGTSVPVSGVVIAGTSSISSLTVNAGNGAQAVALNPDGSWRVDALALPAGAADVTISVEATDAEGRKSSARSQLKTSDTGELGTGQYWDSDIVGIDVDSSTNKLWMISYASSRMQLLSVDLNNGNRSATISDFSNPTQGLSTLSPGSMVFDDASKKVYMSAGKDANSAAKILSIDSRTGLRTLVSDATRGSGLSLGLPLGIVVNNAGNLYVADNTNSNIVAVDVATGNRTVVANKATLESGIDAPFLLARDTASSANSLIVSPYSTSPMFYSLDLSGAAAYNRSVAVQNSSAVWMGEIESLTFDSRTKTIFFHTFYMGLTAVDMVTGKVTNLADAFFSVKAISFDEQRGVLYLVKSSPASVYAVDPASRAMVMVSKGSRF